MKSIPYGKQNITDEDIRAVAECLRSDFLTQGPQIAAFEDAFRSYIGVKYAVAVSNGTAALHLAALAAGVNEQSNVITTPITFAASANCIRYCGGKVFFADIDPDNYCLDINSVRKLLESKPKGFFNGLIPVDFAGYAVNMEPFRQLANEYGLWIIEDACHAPGGYFIDSSGETEHCGNCTYADMAVFSFHPVKHIACGEGGMITTNDTKIYENLLLLRTHGITRSSSLLRENHGGWYYEMQELGYNYRLTDMQAALGASQLKRADAGLKRRREIAKRYAERFNGHPLIHGQSGVVDGHAYHLYIIEVNDRLGLYDFLKSKNIFAQVHYIPVHLMPYYRSLGFRKGDFVNSENYYDHCLSLPMYATLTNSEQEYVISNVIEYLESL